MIVRLLIAASVLAAVALLGAPLSSPVPSLQTSSVSAAPAGSWADAVAVSHGITNDAQPIHEDIEYSSGTDHVWISFNLHDHDQNAKISYLARANGDDYKWGTLDKAKCSNCRYAFALDGKNGKGLPGAAYDVRVFVNDAEVAQVGFGVGGKQGLDNGDADSNVDDNDNH